MSESEQKTMKAHVSQEVRAGRYANMFAVHVRNDEVILDAGFSTPEGGDVQIVSRTVMSFKTAQSLNSTMQNALLDWHNKNKKSV